MSQAEQPLPAYVDTSVLVAVLAPDDAHHVPALEWLARHPEDLVTSVIAEVELGRALLRREAPTALRSLAGRLLAGCELVEVTSEIRSTAVGIRPASVRSLDALHIATALVAGLADFATFDMRQRVAAEEAGLVPVDV